MIILLTTTEAAVYLAARGFTVGRRYSGGRGPVSVGRLARWCASGKLAGAERHGEGNRATWYIPQAALDALLACKQDK